MVTPPSDPKWLSFQERFAQVARQSPERTALIDQRRARSYQELDDETSGLSLELQRRGVGCGDLIIVYMSSSSEYVASCLATLKAGAAFLPIPVDLPRAQLELIIEDAQPKVLLTSAEHSPTLVALNAQVASRLITVDERRLAELSEALSGRPSAERLKAVRPGLREHLAFATYTSGTTGKPKGVLQLQGALVDSYDARHRFNPYEEGERVACNVFFMWEILRPLLVGATTVVIPDELIAVPKRLTEYLRALEVTEVLFTPSAFQRLIRSVPAERLRGALSGLRTIWLNGEVVTTKLVAEALSALPSQLKLLNTYSICECHDVSNADLKRLPLDELTRGSGGICPVGYADEGVVIRVMTAEGLKAEGEGELYIGGHGLGAGYLHLDALTTERFPVIDGQRYYATGDLSHVDAEGLITIKGRLGTMVKMRGYSVYLNSIEEALRLHPLVKDVRVYLRGEHLSQHLTAFLVAEEAQLADLLDERSQSAPQLRAWLTQHVPPYMIPSKWVRVDHLPVHPISGKLDQEALWALERVDSLSLELLQLAPQASWEDCELLMRQLWARALEVDLERVSAESDFYDLGGHSLSMVDLVMSVEEVFAVSLEGDELYERPTLSAYMRKALATHPARPEAYELEPEPSPEGPFWEPSDLELMWPEERASARGEAPKARVTLTEARAALLTGGTGHLGLGLLEGLMSRLSPEAKLYCLARPSQSATASERLISRYERAGLGSLVSALNTGRLEVIEGDICDPRLGVSAQRYQRLSQEVDLIFHCAALVNLRARYEQVRPSIVEGTRHMLRFALTGRSKTFHHISTNSTVAGEGEPYVEESAARYEGAPLLDGYSQAKWVAERLAEQAAAQGLPVTVYRPGNIGPHRQTGYYNPSDLLSLLLSACAQLKATPSATAWSLELTPMDVTANLILSLAELPQPRPRYHLVHPQPVSLDELFLALKERGEASPEVLDWREWRARLAASGVPSNMLLSSSLPYFSEQLTSQARFEIEHLRADLPEQALYFERPLEVTELLTGLWPRLLKTI